MSTRPTTPRRRRTTFAYDDSDAGAWWIASWCVTPHPRATRPALEPLDELTDSTICQDGEVLEFRLQPAMTQLEFPIFRFVHLSNIYTR